MFATGLSRVVVICQKRIGLVSYHARVIIYDRNMFIVLATGEKSLEHVDELSLEQKIFRPWFLPLLELTLIE
jgi:hypothetical protein